MYQNFSKRQLLAMTWWNRPKLGQMEGIICDGAIRSGKTSLTRELYEKAAIYLDIYRGVKG